MEQPYPDMSVNELYREADGYVLIESRGRNKANDLR